MPREGTSPHRRNSRWLPILSAALVACACTSTSSRTPPFISLRPVTWHGGCFNSGRLPIGLSNISLVPGAHQVWATGYPQLRSWLQPPSPVQYVLHFSGGEWTKVVTFKKNVLLAGISAISRDSAWLWGGVGSYPPRPLLARVTGNTLQRMKATWLSRRTGIGQVVRLTGATALVTAVTSRPGPSKRFYERWDGTSWHAMRWPTRPRELLEISGIVASGESSALGVRPLAAIWRWNGEAWSRSFVAPPSENARGWVPDRPLLATSSPASAVAVWNITTDSKNPSTPPKILSYSAFFNGSTWTMVPVPQPWHFTSVAMAGGRAWATGKPGILVGDLAHGWHLEALPPPCGHCPRQPDEVAATSPDYVIAAAAVASGRCRASPVWVYDGHRWAPLAAQP
jgi:hypothetical protein